MNLRNRMVRRVKDSSILYVVELYADGVRQYTHETFYSKEEAIEAANEDVEEYVGYKGNVVAKVIEIDAEYGVVGEGWKGKKKVVYEVDNNMTILSDSRRVADYRGQYIGESQYKDKYIELADMLYRMIPDGLTYQEAGEILEDEGLVLVEYGGEEYRYAVYAYEDDVRFGDYGNSDAGVWLDYESDGEMYVTDAYKVG